MLFSIITITYNADKVLERTLKSIHQQTYQNFEHIIIDAASTDQTMNLVAQYTTENTFSISEPDEGLYYAMNKGLSLAKGKYIWFLNAGDEFHQTQTLEIVARCTQNNPDILYGETDIKDLAGNYLYPRRLKAPKLLNWKSFTAGMLVCHQAFIVRKLIAPTFNTTYQYSADFDWCIRCLKNANTVLNTQHQLCYYLSQGLTTANRKASLKERYLIMCNYYGVIPTFLRHIAFVFRLIWSSIFNKSKN